MAENRATGIGEKPIPVVVSRPSRLDRIMAMLSVILVGSSYIDLWAHSHGQVEDTFLTPWHALLYATAGTITGVLLNYTLRRRQFGLSWRRTLPFGYGLSLVGVAVFLVGGILDLLWHQAFGFEEDLEALLSPVHLLLATSGAFIVSGPIRSAWHRNVSSRFPAWTPWVISLAMLYSILTAFTLYAHPAVAIWPAPTTESDPTNSSLLWLDLETGAETRIPNDGLGERVFPHDTFRDGRIVLTSISEGSGSLWLLLPDGSDPEKLWQSQGPLSHASISPDESLIAFAADVDGGASIFVIPTEGGKAMRLTSLDGVASSPSWSPDGTEIIFALQKDGSKRIHKVDSDGSSVGKLVELPGNAGAPTWSPGGESIAFEMTRGGNLDIYVMNPDGSDLSRVTVHPDRDQNPSWAPDGRNLAFASTRQGSFDIYGTSMTGGRVHKVSDNPGADVGWAGIAWQDDGSRIVTNASSWPSVLQHRLNRDVHAATSMLIQSAIIAGVILLMMKHATLPLGALSAILTINAVFMTVIFDHYWYVAPAALAGLTGDVVSILTRNWDVRRRARVIPFALLTTWYALYLTAVAVTQDGLGWSIEMTVGTPLLAGVVGLLLSLVVFPAANADAATR